MARKIPNLGPAEWDVLRVLWERGESSVRDVCEALEPRRSLAQTTVATLLTRLRDKGLVRHRKSGHGKAFVYEAALEPSAVQGSVFQRFIKQVFGNDVVSAVSTLVDSHNLSPEQLRQLRQIVTRADDEKSTTKKRKRP